MRDFKEDGDSSWSRFYENQPLGGQLYNGYQQRPLNRFSEYDKEMIRRTMLEQDAIFRNQVYELHRLYRVQRELMSEYQRNGTYRYSLQPETSQSNSFSSQIPSEGTSRMWQMPPPPVASSCYDREPIFGADDRGVPLNFLNENTVKSASIPIGEGTTAKDGSMLDSKLTKFPRRMFDLQLSADVYVDNEDAVRSGKESVVESAFLTTVPFNKICSSGPQNDIKLTLGIGQDHSCREDKWKPNSNAQNGQSVYSLADLNEPVKEICPGEAASSARAHFVGSSTHLVENQGHWLPLKSDTGSSALGSGFHKDKHIDGRTSNILFANKEETNRENSFFSNKSGSGQSVRSRPLFSPGSSSKEKFPMSPVSMQSKFRRPHEIILSDQNNMQAWFEQKRGRGVEIPGQSPHQGLAAPLMPSSFAATPSFNYTSTASLPVPSWVKPMSSNSHITLGGPTLPFLNGTAIQNPNNPFDKWQHNSDLRSHRLGNDPASKRNGFNNVGPLQDYTSQLLPPPINFGKPNLSSKHDSNLEGCRPQRFTENGDVEQLLMNSVRTCLTAQNNAIINETEGHYDNSSGVLSWLTKKPTSNASSHRELDSSQAYPQLKYGCNAVDPGNLKRQEEKSLSFLNVQDLPPSSQTKESRMQRNEASDRLSSKKIFGFPIPDKSQQKATSSSSPQEHAVTDVNKNSEKDVIKGHSSSTQTSLGSAVIENFSGTLRKHINLNFTPKLSEISAEDEMVVVSSQASAPNVAPIIDLEAPVASSAGKQEETLVKEAAENILWMSLDKCSQLKENTYPPEILVPFDTLLWFAEVALSKQDSVKESPDDGLDLFEQMTLQLEETKPEEYWHQPAWPAHLKENEDGKSVAMSLLFAKPRRGQARKRRQKRDFQKDILPVIATLSRQEVTEDLQNIAGLMKDAGQTWQAEGSMRRNTSQNVKKGRARGRPRGPRSLAVSVAEVQASPPPAPPPEVVEQPTNNIEAEADGKSMVGWGRTTRRCRRQKCLPVNVSATLT